MIQTYTSDHHLVINVGENQLSWNYKGDSYCIGIEDGIAGVLGDVFSDLNRQHDNVAKLKDALREAIEDIQSWGDCASDYAQKKHKLGEEIERYKQIIRECN